MTEVDVEHQIKAVQRNIGTKTIETGEAHVLTISQSYDTDPADLWDAVTSVERIPRWFLPISGDLKLGGTYQLEGQAGGTILTCDPPKNFTATWEYGGEVTWIELRLSAEAPGRTRFELEHIAQVDDETWVQFGPGAVGIGWEMALMGLDEHLLSPEADPAELKAWLDAPDGRAYLAELMNASSDAWVEVSIGFGTDPTAAREAGARCAAAYTASPEGQG
jgi:uncharacterized protein YndB with AHSA1/START domain